MDEKLLTDWLYEGQLPTTLKGSGFLPQVL